MKEFAEIIPVSELVINGVYFNAEHHLMQIKKIDETKNILHLFDISEKTNYYAVKFDKHTLIKQIR